MVRKQTNEMLEKLRRYLHETLGVEANPMAWPGGDRVPFFLRERYRFFEAGIDGQRWLFVLDLDDQGEPPTTVRKHLDLIEGRWDGHAIYVRGQITADRRQRLVAQRVPFVVPGNQQYLPMIGVDFRERFRRRRTEKTAMSPAAQALFLLALLRGDEELTPTSTADRLHYSAMTISRAMSELEALGLGEPRSSGRIRRLHVMKPNREAWNQAKEYLRSPVAREHTIPARMMAEMSAPVAGLTALARYTMLAAPVNPEFAVARSTWKELSSGSDWSDVTPGEPDTMTVQVWRYDPELFTDSGCVDRLSLFLSLHDTQDERIQSALEDMLEQLPW